jgi:hypothetical protein
LIRLALLLFVGLNLFSAHRMLSVSLLLAFAHVLMAVGALVGSNSYSLDSASTNAFQRS